MTPNDIQNKRFDKGMSGYKVDDVHTYLAEVATYARGLLEEKEELERKMVVLAEKLEEYREDEDSLRAALIGAQKLGDSVVRDAKKKAEQVLKEAGDKAGEIVADARAHLDKEAITLTKMQNEVAVFKAKILDMYKRHIETIQGIPDLTDASPVYKEVVRDMPPASPGTLPSTVVKEDKVGDFVLHYEEDASASADDSHNAKHKRQSYGNLRFGEEYNLTRKD